jgi:hypothetical protein
MYALNEDFVSRSDSEKKTHSPFTFTPWRLSLWNGTYFDIADWLIKFALFVFNLLSLFLNKPT